MSESGKSEARLPAPHALKELPVNAEYFAGSELGMPAETGPASWVEPLQTYGILATEEISAMNEAATSQEAFAGHDTLPFGFINYVWVSLFWLGITYLWGGVNGVILPKLNEQLVPENYKGTLLGVITATGMLVAVLVQPAAGALSDVCRHPWGRRRPYILAGGVMVIGSLFLMALMSIYFRQWWLLLLCYLILQLSDNISQGAYQGLIPDNVPENRRGRASGAMGIAQLIGNVGGVAGATIFIDQNQPAMAILVIIMVFGFTLIPTILLVRETPLQEASRASRWSIVRGTFSEFIHHKAFVRFIISRLFVLTSIATVSLFALYFLQDVIGVKEGNLTGSYTVLLLVVVGFSLASVFPAAWLSDKIGRKKLVIVSCLLGIIATLCMSTTRDMTWVIIWGSLLGIATGSFNSIDWALATDLIPRGSAGRFMGISNLAGAGSQALAALLGGSLRDGFNALGETFLHVKNVGYTALFIAAALYFVLGIYFLLGVKEPHRKQVN
ncbi:MAG TPA: MFS transporter [Chloroflexia bacterium]|nr:MFS transporter [Chloroflexia bacterium]